MRVVIAGAGPAGAMTALHLVHEAERQGAALQVLLVDPVARWARGVAFATTDPRHLLNIPASRMSAYPDRPDDFLEWHRARHGPTDPYDFLSRGRFGDYLAATLERVVAGSSERVRVEHVPGLVSGIDRDGPGLLVRVGEHRAVGADAVVIATGLPTAGQDWAPTTLRRSPRFVTDPWAPGALDALSARPVDVLLVGTGLTMVDIAVSLGPTLAANGRRLRAVSRSGRLPARHAARPVTPHLPDIAGWGRGLRGIREHAHAHIAAAVRTYDDWRPAVDGLRHRAAELWTRLDEPDRLEFLATEAARWNAARHRIPRPSAAALDGLRAAGVLALSAAEVVDAAPVGDGLRVVLSDGSSAVVGWVVNCTGPRTDVRTLGDPLIADLLRDRPGGALATPATAGMGVRTCHGQLAAAGHPDAALWTLGALRRGELWESTAVPEIRSQAADVASAILSHRRGLTSAIRERSPSTSIELMGRET